MTFSPRKPKRGAPKPPAQAISAPQKAERPEVEPVERPGAQHWSDCSMDCTTEHPSPPHIPLPRPATVASATPAPAVTYQEKVESAAPAPPFKLTLYGVGHDEIAYGVLGVGEHTHIVHVKPAFASDWELTPHKGYGMPGTPEFACDWHHMRPLLERGEVSFEGRPVHGMPDDFLVDFRDTPSAH
jgi:hypothetical protein